MRAVVVLCVLVGCDGSNATKLAFVAQPTGGEAAIPLSPVRVAFLDDNDHVATSEDAAVTITLATPALLAGTTSAVASDGIAAFDGLVIAAPAPQLVLEASAERFPTTTSAPFDVTIGQPSNLSTITANPATTPASGLDDISIIVTLRSLGGLPIPDQQVTFGATGTGAFWYPGQSLVTDAQGQVTVTLSSTVAESKTVTATADALVLSTTVTFTPAPCRPLLGGVPSIDMPSYTRSVRAADIDGDGHLDLVLVEPANLVVMRGLGNGSFRPAERYPLMGNALAVTTADFDSDGEVDVVAMTADKLVRFTNTGNGVLVSAAEFGVAYPLALDSVDLDADGAVDLIVRAEHAVWVFFGVGNGTFLAPTTTPLPIPSYSITQGWLAISDVNADGRLDIVTSDSNSQYDTLLGGPSRTLQPLSAVQGPSDPVALGDLDGDGLADLVQGSYWFRGRGDGTFGTGAMLAPFVHHVTFLRVADINGDGRMDVVAASTDPAPYALNLVLGNGNGTFAPAETRALSFLPESVAIGDFNGDGRADFAISENFNSVHALAFVLATGSAAWSGVTIHGVAAPDRAFFSSRVGDFDGNGTIDFVGVNSATGSLAIQLSAPDLTLTAMPAIAGVYQPDVEVADFNGDHKLDVVSAVGMQLQWFRGHGDGNLDAPVATQTAHVAGTLTAVDLDGNGVLDLAMTNQVDATITIAIGNGDGTFRNLTSYAVGARPNDIDPADLDGDGDIDLVVANANSASTSILLNQGNGTFAPATPYGMAGTPYSATIADLDGDSKLDLAVANAAASTVIIYKGNGNGTFAVSATVPTTMPLYWIAATDLDGDGATDLVGTFRGAIVLRGKGDGTFLPPLFYEVGAIGGASIVDVDHDGRQDFIVPALDPDAGFMLVHNGGCQSL